MKKSKLKYLAVILIAIILSLAAVFSALATFDGWNGSSTSGSGTSHTAPSNAEYSVANDTLDACGYRFYIVNVNNKIHSTCGTDENKGILDIYKTSARQNQAKLFPKRGKVQWVQEYNSNTWENTTVSTSKTDSILSSQLGSKVDLATVKPAEIESWQSERKNLNPLLTKLMNDVPTTASDLPAGARLIVEPIFSLRIEGTDCAMTATEIAIYGALTFGKNSNGKVGSNTSGSWTYISTFTNRQMPNALYTDTSSGLNGMWEKVPGVNTSNTNKSSTSSFSDSYGRYTFDAIIRYGYGVGIAYNHEPTIKIKYNTNSSAATVGNSTYSKNSSNTITKDGKIYYSTVTSGERITLKSPSSFKVTRSGYTLQNKYIFENTTKTVEAVEHKYEWFAKVASDNNILAEDGVITLKAEMQWTPITYTVKYYLDGEEQTSLKQTCTYGEEYSYKSLPTKSGYNVSGWYTGSSSSNKGTLCAEKSSFKNLASTNGATVKRYAYSTKKADPIYTVKYDANGGSGTMSAHTTKTSATIKENAYTKEACSFNGWIVKRSDGKYYNSDSTGWSTSLSSAKKYNSGESYNFSSSSWRYKSGKSGEIYDSDLTFTFIAQWEVIPVYAYYMFDTGSFTTNSSYKTIHPDEYWYIKNASSTDGNYFLESTSANKNYSVKKGSTFGSLFRAGYEFTGWKVKISGWDANNKLVANTARWYTSSGWSENSQDAIIVQSIDNINLYSIRSQFNKFSGCNRIKIFIYAQWKNLSDNLTAYVYYMPDGNYSTNSSYKIIKGSNNAYYIRKKSAVSTIYYLDNFNYSNNYTIKTGSTFGLERDGYDFDGWKIRVYGCNASNSRVSSTERWYSTSGWVTSSSDASTVSSISNLNLLGSKQYFDNFTGCTKVKVECIAQWAPHKNKLSIIYNSGYGLIPDYESEYFKELDTGYRLNEDNNVTKDGVIYKTVASFGSPISSKYGLNNHTTFGITMGAYAEFVGWGVDPDGTGKVFDENDLTLKPEDITGSIASEDTTITLYAVWKPVINIVYSSNGGTISADKIEEGYRVVSSTSPIMKAESATDEALIDDLSKYYNSDDSIASGIAHLMYIYYNMFRSITPSTRYYASHTLTSEHKIAFGNYNKNTLMSDSTFGLTHESGATFKGWNTEPDGTGIHYDTNTVYSIEDFGKSEQFSFIDEEGEFQAGDDVILYAEWGRPLYVYYDADCTDARVTNAEYKLITSDSLPTTYIKYASDNTDSLYMDKSNTYSDYSLKNGSAMGLVRNNKTFVGWKLSIVSKDVNGNNLSPELWYDGDKWSTNETDAITVQSLNNIRADMIDGLKLPTECNRVEMTCKAQYADDRYTIVYDANGGEGTMEPTVCKFDTNITLSENAFTKTGYIFSGWEDWGEIFNDIVYTPEMFDAPYYANTYSDIYENHGYDKLALVNHYISFGQSENRECVGDERGCYPDNAVVKNLSTTPGDTVPLKANWTPITYTIHYYLDGKEISELTQTCVYDESYEYSKLPVAAKGYVCDGWWTNNDGTGNFADEGASFSNLTTENGKSINLYAFTKPIEYLVVFNPNGATEGEMDDQRFKYDVAQELYENQFKRNFNVKYIYNDNKTSDKNELVASDFIDWAIDPEGSEIYSDRERVLNLTSTDGEVIDLYAKWSEIYVMLPSVERTGYKLIGWDCDEGYLGQAGDIVKISRDTVFSAIWEPITYTIVFDGNGATEGSTASMLMTYNETKSLTPNGFSRGYCRFLGWNTRADGNGSNYADEQVVCNLTTEDNAVVTLYAIWENPLDLSLEPIAPNAPYREKTDVISSFYVVNNGTDSVYPSDKVYVEIIVRNESTNEIISTYKAENVVVPENEKQLVYFKWTVPEGLVEEGQLTGVNASVTATLKSYVYSELFDESTFSNVIGAYNINTAVDPGNTMTAPDGYKIPAAPSTSNKEFTWDVWTYNETTGFAKTTYGMKIYTGSRNNVVVTPKATSAYKDSAGNWHMKAGYGITVETANNCTIVTGTTAPTEDMYTKPQYCLALFPEFRYNTENGSSRTMELIDGTWQLRINTDDVGLQRKHYTPLWFTSGSDNSSGVRYTVEIVQSDAWTPMGMLTRKANGNNVYISGTMYDDIY